MLGTDAVTGKGVNPSDTHLRTARRANDSAKLVLRGILLNAILAVVKLAGGVFGHTYALIADAAESMLDILSSTLVWAGFRVAARPPDANHPYGHGKAEPLAGLLVALFIFAMAGWVGLHAVEEIRTPHQGPAWWTLLVLAGVAAIVTEVILLRDFVRPSNSWMIITLGFLLGVMSPVFRNSGRKKINREQDASSNR